MLKGRDEKRNPQNLWKVILTSIFLFPTISLTPFVLGDEDFFTNWDESVEKFDDLGIKEEVLRGIYG